MDAQKFRKRAYSSKSRLPTCSARFLLFFTAAVGLGSLLWNSRSVAPRQPAFVPEDSTVLKAGSARVNVLRDWSEQLRKSSATNGVIRKWDNNSDARDYSNEEDPERDKNSSSTDYVDQDLRATDDENRVVAELNQNSSASSLVPQEWHQNASSLLSPGVQESIEEDKLSPNHADELVKAALFGDPYHNRSIFKEDYEEMMLTFKIFVYPHNRNDPYSNIFRPLDGEPNGNYASESYFKKALMSSGFTTRNASEANMFYLPFSIARLRHDKRVGVHGLQNFVSSYIDNIRKNWPYWNRTAGADHFFVSCHSITRTISENVLYLRINAIQVVCSSNSFVQGYTPHKDFSVPQVWPRKGTPAEAKLIQQRKVLAFFAGAANSPVRAAVVKAWSHDHDIRVHSERLTTPYSQALLTSKFCLHIKGFEVNTARIADAMHFGCVPVIIANHYDLPFGDVLNWDNFAMVVSTPDITLLKKILQGVTPDQYGNLHKNVMEVRKHFQWNTPSREYDTFHMVMYELWSRRHVLRPML